MEQQNIFEYLSEPFKIDKKIRLIELFAGIGSQAKSLENLGADFEHYKAVEIDKYAIKSYNAIHGTDFEPVDITKLKGKELQIVDSDKYCYIMTYSFPCQSISLAGLKTGFKKGSNTESSLLWEVERLLNEVDELPQVLLMENVTQVHNKKNIENFNQWLKFLESKGYSNYWQDLNAKDFGVAQNRDRCFMVSLLGDYNYTFPKPFPLKKVVKDYLEEHVSERYYIKSDKVQVLIDKLFDSGYLNADARNDAIDLSENEPKTIDIANCIDARDRGIRTYRSAGNGVVTQNVKQIGNILQDLRHFDNPHEGRVYDAKYICPCLNSMNGGGREP